MTYADQLRAIADSLDAETPNVVATPADSPVASVTSAEPLPDGTPVPDEATSVEAGASVESSSTDPPTEAPDPPRRPDGSPIL